MAKKKNSITNMLLEMYINSTKLLVFYREKYREGKMKRKFNNFFKDSEI